MPTGIELFATTDELISEHDVRVLASHLAECIGHDRLCIWREKGKHGIVLQHKSEYHLLPDNLPKTESILEVDLSTPYYGPGYQRGYWPEIAATIEFLRHRLPTAKIWYGEDCSSDVHEMTPETTNELWHFWALNGGRRYYEQNPAGLEQPVCDFCPGMKMHVDQLDRIAFCPGCGKEVKL
ncbi:MAG: hypothetical protein ABIR24_09035 [Verrucomicrobiota bacterium]